MVGLAPFQPESEREGGPHTTRYTSQLEVYQPTRGIPANSWYTSQLGYTSQLEVEKIHNELEDHTYTYTVLYYGYVRKW